MIVILFLVWRKALSKDTQTQGFTNSYNLDQCHIPLGSQTHKQSQFDNRFKYSAYRIPDNVALQHYQFLPQPDTSYLILLQTYPSMISSKHFN